MGKSKIQEDEVAGIVVGRRMVVGRDMETVAEERSLAEVIGLSEVEVATRVRVTIAVVSIVGCQRLSKLIPASMLHQVEFCIIWAHINSSES
jgi:hypothetical protein